MIGNDIVDWAQARRESNWQRKGFLAKLFTDKEQQLIHETANPERLIWTLWSMKESVYKADVRQTGKRIFAPRKIACELSSWSDDLIRGTAFHDNFYHTQASLTPDYVTGQACLTDDFSVFQEIIIPFDGVASSHQSAHLYKHLKQACASVLLVPADAVCIRKNEINVPTLVVSTSSAESITLPVSISHHGQYGAFIIDYSDYSTTAYGGNLR